MVKVSGVLAMTILKMLAFFGVDNNSSSGADNLKNKCLVLDKGNTFGINGSFGAPEKKFSINFSKANTKFCLSLYYNANNNYLFVNEKEIFKLIFIKMLIFQHSFVWEVFLMDFVLLSLGKYF